MENKTNEDEIAFLSKKILELNDRLIDSESAKSGFLSLIASELNNPMTALLGMIPHLKIEDTKQNKKHFDLIHYEVLKLNFRVQNLVLSAEIESGHVDVEYSLFDLQEIIDEVIESLIYVIKERNITININNKIDKKIVTDSKIIYMIAKNLLSNGCKYGIRDGVIDIDLFIEESMLTIKVKNQGEGPKVKYKPEVYTRFSKNAHGKHGIGLGLSVVRELCEILDGNIDYFVKDGYVTFVAKILIDENLINSEKYNLDDFLFESFDNAVEL